MKHLPSQLTVKIALILKKKTALRTWGSVTVINTRERGLRSQDSVESNKVIGKMVCWPVKEEIYRFRENLIKVTLGMENTRAKEF